MQAACRAIAGFMDSDLQGAFWNPGCFCDLVEVIFRDGSAHTNEYSIHFRGLPVTGMDRFPQEFGSNLNFELRMLLARQVQWNVMPVAKAQFRQIQLFVRRDRMSQALLQESG